MGLHRFLVSFKGHIGLHRFLVFFFLRACRSIKRMDVRFRIWASGFQGLPIKVSAADKAAVKKGMLGG